MRITFTQPDDVMYEVDQRRAIIVSDAEFEELADEIRRADPVRAELERERDEVREQAELWRKLAERQDNTAPLRSDLASAEAARDELRRQVDYLKRQVDALSGVDAADVDELKAVIVSQAREIARLKGESE
ncbi:hypothetical protein [Streptomyces eurythermus]